MRIYGRGILRYSLLMLPVLGGSFAALQCVPDEDTSVAIIKDCDVGALAVTPPEATVKVFVQAMSDALTRAQDFENRFRDACNAINRDLGEAEGGDIRSACNKIAARISKVIALTPVPDGGLPASVPPWVSLGWDETCSLDTHALATCIDTCSGQAACNHDSKCSALIGTCSGACNGGCAVTGEKVACSGECRGACDMPAPPAADSGIEAGTPQTCAGECIGACKTPTWTGNCDKGCDKGFVGQCLGTCTGTCDDTPVGPVKDAGPEGGFDAGDDAGEGGVEGGAPDGGADGGGSTTAPTGQDGNCQGLCKGQCSSGASGSCTLRCTGAFSGGICNGNGNCIGQCVSPSNGCTTTCTGTCTGPADGGTCTGSCQGQCAGAVTANTCRGTLDCQADDQCKAACGVRAALSTKCPPVTTGDVRVAGDGALYKALQAHIGEFATIVNEFSLLKAAFDRDADRTPSDFKSIGLVSDTGFRCVDSGISTATKVRESLNRSAGATTILRGTQF